MTDLINRSDVISVLIRWLSGEELGADIIDLINSLPSTEAAKVAYICDGRKCDSDCSECFRTTDIEHAKNFIRLGDAYMEQAEAEQVTGKLKNPCNPLLTDEVEECKEKKSKLDLISRADAIEAVGKYKEEHGYAYYDCACDIENDLKQLPSASVEVGEWIPCSERLPSENGRYLVTYPLFVGGNKWVNVLWYGKPSMPNIKVKGKCWYRSDDEYGDVVYDDILAWMPLPKPYKGGDDE